MTITYYLDSESYQMTLSTRNLQSHYSSIMIYSPSPFIDDLSNDISLL
jgi:hypothetical protein